MTIEPGALVRPLGTAEFVHDDTVIANLVSTSYTVGTPEVGVFFTAPASGTVRLTIGGGVRDNDPTNTDRIFLSPQVFLTDSGGEVFLTPSVTLRGFGSANGNTEFHYGSRISLITGLTAGAVYYARVMYLTTAGTDPDSADIAARDVIVIPMP